MYSYSCTAIAKYSLDSYSWTTITRYSLHSYSLHRFSNRPACTGTVEAVAYTGYSYSLHRCSYSYRLHRYSTTTGIACTATAKVAALKYSYNCTGQL
jgi:hypothetical protein